MVCESRLGRNAAPIFSLCSMINMRRDNCKINLRPCRKNFRSWSQRLFFLLFVDDTFGEKILRNRAPEKKSIANAFGECYIGASARPANGCASQKALA
jgi:hypothetical protein